MRSVSQSLVSLVFLFLASGSAWSQTTNTDAEIEELLQLTNVRLSLEQIPLEFEKQRNDPPEVRQKAELIRGIITKHHQPDILYRMVFNSVKQSYDKTRISSLLDAYRSAFVRRFSEFERQSLMPHIEDSLIAFQQSLKASPPTKERQETVGRIEKATASVDIALTVMGNTLRTLALGINPALPPGQRASASQIENRVAAAKSQLRATVQEAIYVRLHFTYRTASDYALKEYVKFLETDNTRWLTKTINGAFLLALKVAAENARIEIGEALQ